MGSVQVLCAHPISSEHTCTCARTLPQFGGHFAPSNARLKYSTKFCLSACLVEPNRAKKAPFAAIHAKLTPFCVNLRDFAA
jgi:hypothetical protein